MSSVPGRIVATVLCGNAESLIESAILSVSDWVDEICLIDTGSTDGTVARAESLAGGKIRRCAFSWCADFSRARNAALELAEQSRATWALTLDTDERLEFPGYSNRQQLLQVLDSESSVLAWLVPAEDGSYVKERFVRIPTSLRWQGRTHECLTGAAAGERRWLPGCRFTEVPKSAEAFQIKLARDLKILVGETARQPQNPRWWYYLGQTHEGLQQYREAIDAFQRCIKLDGWPEESSWACFCAARCFATFQEFHQAEELCALGMSRNFSAPELPWMLAWCCYQRGAWADSVTWSHVAIELGSQKPDERALSFRYMPAWYEAPYDVLHYAYRKLGQSDLANRAAVNFQLAQCRRLRAADPSSTTGIIVHEF